MSLRLDQFRPRQLLQLFCGVMAGWLVISLLTTYQVGRRLRVITSEVRQERQLLRVERDLAGELPATRERYDAMLADLDPLEPSPPSRLYLSGLLVQMTELAAAHQLELIGALPDPLEAVRGPLNVAPDPRHRVVLTFAGRFPDLLAMVEALQTAPKAIAVRAIRVEQAAEDEDGRIVATLAVTAYEVPGILEDNRLPIPAGGFELFRHNGRPAPARREPPSLPEPPAAEPAPLPDVVPPPEPEEGPFAPPEEGPFVLPEPPAPESTEPAAAPDEGLPSGPTATPPTIDSGRPELIRPPIDRPSPRDEQGQGDGDRGARRSRRNLTPEQRERLRNLSPEERERLREQWRQKNGEPAREPETPENSEPSRESGPFVPSGSPGEQGLVF